MKKLILFLTVMSLTMASYFIGYHSGCLKVIGKSENIGAALDLFCYGDSDHWQESLNQKR
jgi:hypothetical protein